MDRSFWRLLVICFAWSLGAALVYAFDAPGMSTIVPAIFAVAAAVLTGDQGRGPSGGGPGGNVKYWRGRRVDDRTRDRWH